MAGRVEKIINNKSYFVLDEVGTSDNDSDVDIVENDNKKNNKIGLQMTLSNKTCQGNNNNNPSNKFETNEMIKASSNSTESMCSIVLEQNLLNNQNIVGNNNEEKIKVNNDNCTSSPDNPETIDLSPEETSVIDMEIDSEEEFERQNSEKIDPFVTITFRDQPAEKLLKSSLIKFLSQKVEECSFVTNKENSLELKVYEKKAVKLLKNDILSFDLDTTPTHGKYCEVPKYGKNNNFGLYGKNLNSDDNEKNLNAPKVACFNCLGKHPLKDCVEVKDFRTINKNRLEFLNKAKANKAANSKPRYVMSKCFINFI